MESKLTKKEVFRLLFLVQKMGLDSRDPLRSPSVGSLAKRSTGPFCSSSSPHTTCCHVAAMSIYFLFFCTKKKKSFDFFFVQKMGLEPTRHCCHRHLKPARLPIPPFLHKPNVSPLAPLIELRSISIA